MMHFYYQLQDDGTVTPCDMETYAATWPRTRNVAHAEWLDKDIAVSTVFLGINHAFGDGPPVLFETLVFAKDHPAIDEEMERYCTRDEAIAGHNVMVDTVAAYLLLHKAALV